MCLKTRKTQNGPAHCTERIRNCGICGIFYQVYSKGILLFSNGIVKTWETFQIKWDLLVILNVFKLNLVICLHSNNAHLKKKIGARHGSFKGTMCMRRFLRRQKWFSKCALSYFFSTVYNLSACEFAVCKAPITSISLYHKAVNPCFSGKWFFSQAAIEGRWERVDAQETVPSKAWTPSWLARHKTSSRSQSPNWWLRNLSEEY